MDENLSTGPILLLTQLSRLINRRSTPELLGQTLKELGALSYLRDYDEVPQQALVDGLCIDANYCVLLLNDLESSDLVERRRDPTDRRRHLVSMTDEGRKALHRAEAAQQTLEDEILGALNEDERATLTHLLRKAIDGQNVAAAANKSSVHSPTSH
ncbi:MAG: transcriptional regulator, MarR family [Acidimicrobiaceae bacterium]|nr:transcriptional regulator, MarR family [Acidimicrobiaceae bacterium]